MSDFENSAPLDLELTGLERSLSNAADMAANFDAEMKRVQGTMANTNSGLKDLENSLSRTLKGALQDIAFDGKKLSEALRDIGRSMASTALNTAVKPVASHASNLITNSIGTLVQGIFPGLGAASPGAAVLPALSNVGASAIANVLPFANGGIFTQGRVQAFAQGGAISQGSVLPFAKGGAFSQGQLLPFANGASFTQGRVAPFASGGIVSAPTTFPMRGATGLMGEAGPEAIMPLSRGPDGKLGVQAQSGGTRAPQVVVNISTPDVAGFQRSQTQIAAQMSRVLGRAQRAR